MAFKYQVTFPYAMDLFYCDELKNPYMLLSV